MTELTSDDTEILERIQALESQPSRRRLDLTVRPLDECFSIRLAPNVRPSP